MPNFRNFVCILRGSLQRTIGALYTVTDRKDWLSTRSSYPDKGTIREFLKSVEKHHMELKNNAGVAIALEILPELEDVGERFNKYIAVTTRGSLFSAQMLATPSTLINYSLAFFYTGLAVYLGFLWTRNLDTSAGPNDSRNVFIIFLICYFFCAWSYWVPHALKDKEVIPIRLYRRLLVSYEDLIQGVKERISEQQIQPPGLNSVYKPVPTGKESGLPTQAVENDVRTPEDTTASSVNQFPFHSSQYAEDTINKQRLRDMLSRHTKDSPNALGTKNATNNIANDTPNAALISALQAAAQAHDDCANADRKVAQARRELVNSMTARNNGNDVI